MHALRPALLAFGLCLSSCSRADTPTTVTDERVAGRGLLVQLESVDPLGGEPFAHPLPAEESALAGGIEVLLAELAYGRPRGKQLYRLIADPDRKRLAAALAQGLRRAGPRERIRFVVRVEDRSDNPWFTPDERLTRGVAFVGADGRFNLAFDLVDEPVDPNDPDPHDPTQRAQTRARMVSETGRDMGSTQGGPRRLWVAWDHIPLSRDAPRN